MATRINQFITQIGQGVKPNMFSVDIQFPGSNLSSGTVSDADRELVNVLCKSAALPASNLGVIEVPFRGRTVKIAGDRTFDTWTATFFNDKDMKIRSFFESWLESMNTHEGNYSLTSFLRAKMVVTWQLSMLSNLRSMVLRVVKSSDSTNFSIASQPMSPRLILLMIAMIRLKSSRLNSSIPTGRLSAQLTAT